MISRYCTRIHHYATYVTATRYCFGCHGHHF